MSARSSGGRGLREIPGEGGGTHLSPAVGYTSGGPVIFAMVVAAESLVVTLEAYWHPIPHAVGFPLATCTSLPLGWVVP